ncbi:hypothetical protein [Thiohalomonas denitrificans]|uniref:hypothetical protein n=1 Tax=Thiohalomonas denitrificans TaxID=415747 RepID=UPI0026F25F63|nr:hypothetical protein [Thiohalomonas denitrificans]
MRPPRAQDYVALLRLYRTDLRQVTETGGNRFELLFLQVIRLLGEPSPFNQTLPAPFLDVARRYSRGELHTLSHFQHDENRQFFLSDLYDYLKMQTDPSERKA